MICPSCEGEFVDGIGRCPDCELALEDREPEPEPPPLEASGASVAILRTGKLFEADLAASLLEEAEVPHFRQEQNSVGLSFAMPVAPSAGPGTWWVIRVPEEAAERARAVLAEHPFELDEPPGVWDFAPTTEARTFFKGWALLWLVLFAAMMAMGVLSFVRNL